MLSVIGCTWHCAWHIMVEEQTKMAWLSFIIQVFNASLQGHQQSNQMNACMRKMIWTFSALEAEEQPLRRTEEKSVFKSSGRHAHNRHMGHSVTCSPISVHRIYWAWELRIVCIFQPLISVYTLLIQNLDLCIMTVCLKTRGNGYFHDV